jgi:hypothetical protein
MWIKTQCGRLVNLALYASVVSHGVYVFASAGQQDRQEIATCSEATEAEMLVLNIFHCMAEGLPAYDALVGLAYIRPAAAKQEG